MSATRRLAAILAADVVGYSRLLEQDEAGTLAALRERRRDILNPLVGEHHGRIVKVMGDGVLVEFGSAVNAVACAVELQKRMIAANDGLGEDRHIDLRVGVNLGDVVVEGGDLYGDGVIIAVRLQAMAEPGGICVSGGVHDQVGSKLPLAFDDLGPCEVKNIARPVQVFRATINKQGAARLGTRQPQQVKPSIAVLPFVNMSGDPTQQYFSDGVTEDIITELSRFRELFVIARHSSFQYRDKATDMKRVGRELGVQFLVEGSMRKMGQRVLIIAHLIDAATGNHLWADRYDRVLEDIFAVQEEVTRTIVATVAGRLENAVTESAKRTPTRNLAAYDCLLRGREALMATYFDPSLYEQDTIGSARELLRRAVELDPGLAQAYANLAQSYLVDWWYLGKVEDIERAVFHAQMAVRLDPDDSISRDLLGTAHLYRRNYDEALVQLERAIAINPNNASAAHHMGLYKAYAGRHAEAIDWERRAMRLNPYHPGFYREHLGYALFLMGRYEEALAALRSLDRLPYWAHAYLAACYIRLNRPDDARVEASAFMAACSAAQHDEGGTKIAREAGLRALVAEIDTYMHEADRDRWLGALRVAGIPV